MRPRARTCECMLEPSILHSLPKDDGLVPAFRKSLKRETICWSYTKEDGPHAWHKLGGVEIVQGANQSPIDLEHCVTCEHTAVPLETRYREAHASVVNNGRTVQVHWPAGSIDIGGKIYTLVQFHFHSPSEHTVEGVLYSMEMHLVHQSSSDGSIAVLGVLFEEKEDAPDNAFLQQFWDKIPRKERYLPAPVGILSPKGLYSGDVPHWRYPGSLTTPPCTEGVTWTIFKEPMLVNPAQVARFKECVPLDNNRPVQPPNGRVVEHV